MQLSKKAVLSVSLFVLILWGVVLSTFANPPTSPYAVSQNIVDPACAPNSANCYVASLSIGDTISNNPDTDGILYTDTTGKLATDDLFTRNSVTKETNIGKNFDIPVTVVSVTLSRILLLDPNDVSGPLSSGDNLVGVTSGATATLEYYNSSNGFAYLSNVAGTFQTGETINDVTASQTAVAGQLYNDNPFVLDDTINFYSMGSATIVATGKVTAISGNTYTVEIQSATSSPAVYDLALDNLQNTQKIYGLISFSALPSGSAATTGSIHVGSLFGGVVQGVSNFYGDPSGNKFSLNFVGTAFGGGNTYSAGTIVGDITKNNFANIVQSLYGRGGSPEIEIGVVDAHGSYNSNILLNQNRMVFQNNQDIALLGRVQIGEYDYNNDDPNIHMYPAFSNYYYLPTSRGSAGQVLMDVNGDGNASWQTPSSANSLIGSTSTLGSETWLGSNAGGSGGSNQNTLFLGINAGYNAPSASSSVFLGLNAGRDAMGAYSSNFFGDEAGYGAISANTSNFIGSFAGYQATSANNSNFIGDQAGQNATNANNAVFMGHQAGISATDAHHSNFIGTSAGAQASAANNSNFIGNSAGYNATNAQYANFIGAGTGNGATDAMYANFIGSNTGYAATNAAHSNFMGAEAGANAINARYSNFMGAFAGKDATGAHDSNFFGDQAGQNASNAYYSNFFGIGAGYNATNALNSNFFGNQAGQNATDAIYSNFLGGAAGFGANNAGASNFFGDSAGYQAYNADHSNFFGQEAGKFASNASGSNFIGPNAGYQATNALNSNFFGFQAGSGATNAARSIFIGENAGAGNTTLDNTATNTTDNCASFFSGYCYSILIGNFTSTGGFSNSIALGSNVTNTASNQFMVGSTTRPIDTTIWKGSAGTECTLTTGTGVSCTSDERLKTNITNLTNDTLDKLLNVKTVTYNWLENPDSPTQIGFLAQDLEQYFPELVDTNKEGKKSVYYSQMTPILVEAIREINLKITNITAPTEPSSIVEKVIARLIKADRVETKELCVDDVCVTRDQFLQMVQSSGQVPAATPPTPSSNTTSPTCTLPQVLNQTGDACIDPPTSTPPTDTSPTVEPQTPTE